MSAISDFFLKDTTLGTKGPDTDAQRYFLAEVVQLYVGGENEIPSGSCLLGTERSFFHYVPVDNFVYDEGKLKIALELAVKQHRDC